MPILNPLHHQREKKVRKTEIKQNQEDHKNRMQEELLRKSHQKEVSIQEAQEKCRRITETMSQISDGDEAKAKAIDMLIDVQKQLLDVFAITKVRRVLYQCLYRVCHTPGFNQRPKFADGELFTWSIRFSRQKL